MNELLKLSGEAGPDAKLQFSGDDNHLFFQLGDRLLISPRFHRLHHGVRSAGRRSCNYGSVLPWWDMMFRTADFAPVYVGTGDPSGLLKRPPWSQRPPTLPSKIATRMSFPVI